MKKLIVEGENDIAQDPKYTSRGIRELIDQLSKEVDDADSAIHYKLYPIKDFPNIAKTLFDHHVVDSFRTEYFSWKLTYDKIEFYDESSGNINILHFKTGNQDFQNFCDSSLKNRESTHQSTTFKILLGLISTNHDILDYQDQSVLFRDIHNSNLFVLEIEK